jgi:hypothetical protein
MGSRHTKRSLSKAEIRASSRVKKNQVSEETFEESTRQVATNNEKGRRVGFARISGPS